MRSDYTTIQVSPTTPSIGADVHGIDLREPLNTEQLQEIRQAFLDHLVLFSANRSRCHPSVRSR